MDSDNPWGNPSPSPNPSPAVDSTSTPTSPRLSYDSDDDERPQWGTQEQQKEEDATPAKQEEDAKSEEEQVEVTDTVTDDEAPADEEDEENAPEQEDKHEEKDKNDEQPTPADDAATDSPPPAEAAAPEPDAESPTTEADSSPAAEPAPLPSSPPAAAVSVPALPPSFDTPPEGPPMDDFDDDFDSPPAGAVDEEDDFDDFGDVADGGDGDDDDFGDFGDFGEAAPLDASAFEAPAALAPPVPVVAPTPARAATPAPGYPPLRLDLTNAARRDVAPQLKEFCAAVWTEAAASVGEEPERQVEGVGQVMVTESSRSLLANLSSLPQLRPLDWRRSKIRREHLVSMGIPVNLDDSSDSKLPSLSLSTRSRFGPAAGPALSSPTRSVSAPPLGGPAFPLSGGPSSLPGSRSSTPFADRERSRGAQAPVLDTRRAEELLGIREEDLTLLPLGKLREMSDELERISVEASGVLTHALMMREKEGQDKEVYNGMIQDLVIAAAKMKTSSAAGQQPKRSGSGRWGR
ncbi:hypothetical protein JCM10207_002951 [Rhodosporidiobolus poonsookiae]